MSTGVQVDLDWPGIGEGQGGAAASSANAPGATRDGGGDARYLSDEEILGITPIGTDAAGEKPNAGVDAKNASVGARHAVPLQPAKSGGAGERPAWSGGAGGTSTKPGVAGETPTESGVAGEMPQWMQAIAADPKNGAEAQQLWQEHQAFRASFSSPEEARVVADEARAIKELFPGGAQEAAGLRQAAQSVDRIDAAIFSGDSRAQAEVVAELAAVNPVAFRALFAEAAKVLAGMGVTVAPQFQAGPTLRENREGWGTQQTDGTSQDAATANRPAMGNRRQDAGATGPAGGQGPVTNHPPSPNDGFGGRSPFANPGSQITNHDAASSNHQSPVTGHQSPSFDPAAYASFEQSTNDVVARDVRTSISDTLARVLPDGVAEGAARRIGDDVFNEIHRALAGDRALSEQVGQALRASVAAGQGWRFGSAEQQRVASLLAGRAKQLVPSVARRVIGEWTSSVLGTARSKAARQAAAASRVDIAAAGGTLDSMPIRAMSPREVNYASMSDDEILGM